MKKLLFCLLTLVGTGMFYSCQQDEIVNEAPASKGATITATLPTNPESRLAIGENFTEYDALFTKLEWQIGDIVTIEDTDYKFVVGEISDDGTTATLYCKNAPDFLPANPNGYRFVYGNNYDNDKQSGTLDSFYMFTWINADENVAWENVNLEFSGISAIVEIELPDEVSATKVSLYDSSNGALIASTVKKENGSYTGKVYLSVITTMVADDYIEVGAGLVLVETSNGNHVAQLSQQILKTDKLYSINKSKIVPLPNIGTSGTVKYGSVGNTFIIYGEGAIPNPLFANNSGIQHAIILEGVSSIGNAAFGSNTSLASVRVPASVNSIGQAAFQNCTSLKTITIEQGSQLTTIDGSAFFGCTALESITIPASVTSIGQVAFYGCTAIASITIPASVNSIGPNAFQNCTSLETVTIEQGSHLTTIDESAFYGCTALESIEIPASVTSIGQVAFYGCTSLKTVTCLAVEPPTLGNIVFDECNDNLTIYVPSEEVVETYKETSGWSFYAGKIQAIP